MHLDVKLFISLFLGFILATIIGTLSHELGHYVVAEWLGYDATIHFGSIGIIDSGSIPEGSASDGFWITLGGPLQTMLTGSIGLILLFINHHRFNSEINLVIRQWFLIFLSLFWLRQPANLFNRLGAWIIHGHLSSRGDEIRLAHYLNMPDWSILIFTAIIGTMVLAAVYFLFIPQKQRMTFILAGLSGGVIGYLLWLKMVGKVMIP